MLGSAVMAVSGCSADVAGAGDEGETEDAAATQEELTTSGARLAGAFHGAGGSTRAPTFEGIVFQQNGEFFADIDTGIRCVRAPCPSHVRLVGRFTATRSFVRLSPLAGEQAQSFHGRYRYTLANDKLTLTRAGWTNTLDKELSYCAEPSDCSGQVLIHPMCVGGWTCGEQRSCSWQCGTPSPTSAVWPADRTQLVAESPGGGFTPPPPAGSTCAVGAQKYSLDIATRKLSWEVCDLVDWNTPMHLVTGSRTLTEAELATVDAAMNEVTAATHDFCGADKPYLYLEVTSASQGTKKYLDSFYSCQGGSDTYVDNIDGVFSAFRDLAH